MCYVHANCNNVTKDEKTIGKIKQNKAFCKIHIANVANSYYDKNVHEHTEKVYIEKEKV